MTLSQFFGTLGLAFLGIDFTGDTRSLTKPSGIKLTSGNNTVGYIFIDNSGNIRTSTTEPVLNSDGSSITASIPAGSITSTQLDPTLQQRVQIALSSAQLLALNGTPVTVIAAPAAGKSIIVQDVLFRFTGGTAYAAGGNITLQYNGGAAVINAIANTVINTTASSDTGRQAIDATATQAAAITISNATQAFTTGTGTAIVDVVYRVI